MRTHRPHGKRAAAFAATFVATIALTAGTVLAGAGSAQAAPNYLRYKGTAINMAKVPATVVSIDAIANEPLKKVQFLLGTKVVGEDTHVEKLGDQWIATADVDLTGTNGTTMLTARYVAPRWSYNVWNYYRAIPPAAKPPTDKPDPGSAGRRGPTNTGVPAGLALKPSKGFKAFTDGAVYDGLDVDGCVEVYAKDVTIRNSRIRCSNPRRFLAVYVARGDARLVLEDVEVDGTATTDVCVGWTSYALRRTNLHGCVDGARMGSDVTIEDSWIHDLSRKGSLHPDAIQTTSGRNVTIRGNTLSSVNDASGDAGNAALMMGSESAPRQVRNFLVEKNDLDGGSFTLNVRGDIDASGVTIRDNAFGRDFRYGPVLTPYRVPVASGNVYSGTSAAVPVEHTR